MKPIIAIRFSIIMTNNLSATEMKKQIIKTKIGNIAVFSKTIENTTPIIFLHGVYFDHYLWDKQIEHINDRTVIAIDMPLHGESNYNIAKEWNLDDCANMLIEILENMGIEKVIAIGHSWGSMTIIRACTIQPNRFQSIGVCNMPWESGVNQKNKFFWQHTMLGFRKFYTKQAAKSIFGKTNLKSNPNLLNELTKPMSLLSNEDIKQIDKQVIVNANDVSEILKNLNVKSLALIGKDDYLKPPPYLETQIVQGGHISPIQAGLEVLEFIKKVVRL
jgi:3-oxoadipate enol-lactonase